MMTRKLGPAMAAGCTSVVKPAERDAADRRARSCARSRTPACRPASSTWSRRARRAWSPSSCSPTPRVRKISFTGSTEVGKELIRRSADQVKRLSLELGGHAPYVIFDDADLDEAVDGLIASKFRNAGQTCVCANRVYVQRGIYDELRRAAWPRRSTKMVVGNGTTDGVTIGPLIDERAVDKAEEHVQDAIAHGARARRRRRAPRAAASTTAARSTRRPCSTASPPRC